jgi:hypothetical protein
MQPWFLSELKNKVYIIFDASHMIKLMRNTLHAYKILKSPSGEIQWELIEKLHNRQEECGLRLANKLTPKHINFCRQKMKVALATQLLSNSVAKALRAVKEIEPTFGKCTPTAEFIEVKF